MIESISGVGEINWDEIYTVKESKKIIAIYIGRSRALIFPKDEIRIQRNDGVQLLKTFVRNNVPVNKVKFF